jgi:hypothetical protein
MKILSKSMLGGCLGYDHADFTGSNSNVDLNIGHNNSIMYVSPGC